MQIIIPMSGFGERFRRAGYALPKPLIALEGKPIIAHVLDMFPESVPGEHSFLFICNQEHLEHPAYRLAETLRELAPNGRVIGIAPHQLGPVHAVLQAEAMIDLAKPTIINYCDFTCYWDFRHFQRFVAETGCAGAIPAYRGFHPHTLGSTNYAYLREAGGWVRDIQEKQPYTQNRMEEYASSGTYYFSSGQLMLDALEETMKQGRNVGGEYYVSLAYKALLGDVRPVAVYPLQHFMQWGTPEDVAEYQVWSAAFRRLGEEKPLAPAPRGTLIMPMAGLGKRFADEGYAVPKPLIDISGRPMVLQAADDLPQASAHAFVLRADMPGHGEIAQTLAQHFPGAVIETVGNVTEGQACTALLGLEALARACGDVEGPVTFGACDNGAVYDAKIFGKLCDDDRVDVIVWGARGHANAARHPHMFGWIDADKDGRIAHISVKTPLADPTTDPIVMGTFTFRRADDFRRAAERLIARNGRINGEFYIDSCINDAIALGLTCHIFEVEHYLSWGTPNDARTFEYWQSCFHKWPSHPYRLENDTHIPAGKLAALEERFRAWIPPLPEKP